MFSMINALLFDFNLVSRCLLSEVLGRGLGLVACVLDSITGYGHIPATWLITSDLSPTPPQKTVFS